MEQKNENDLLRESVQVDEKEKLDKLKITEFRESIKGDYTGKICPICNLLVKEKKIKLNKKLCLSLIHILKYYRHTENIEILDYFDANELFLWQNCTLKRDLHKLLYWDLVEAKGKMVDGVFEKEKDMYRISSNGIKFAQREVGIPIYAVVYGSKVRGHQLNPNKTIDEILNVNSQTYEQLLSPEFDILDEYLEVFIK